MSAPPSAPAAPPPDGGASAVRAVYRSRLADRRDALAASRRRAGRLSNARLAVFLAGVVLAGFAFGGSRVDPRWLAFPTVAFVGLVVAHDRALRQRDAAARAARYYEDGLARLDGEHTGRAPTGERFRDPEHPYAEDLDCFGAGSLFELLCQARTSAGETTLAGWLLHPAAPDEVRARQRAVAELAPALDLRESLAAVAEAVAAGLHPDALVHWGASAPPAPARAVRLAAAALGTLSAVLAGATLAGAPLLVPWLATLGAEAAFAAALHRRVRTAVTACEAPARDLALLARLLAMLEGSALAAPRLVALRQAIAVEGVPASRRIARLGRLVEILDARRNQLFAPIGASVLFTTQVALAIEAWRARVGCALRAWIDAVGELEALASLATHAYEAPDAVFPELVESGPRFEAEGVGHPLLPDATCVRNDVRLGTAPAVLLVSGSNMSGKSTLLRSVGVTAVLAQAGAPVRARRVVLSPLAVGASLRVFDSLQAGHSHFYAEIRRLRSIVGLAEADRPLLFLLDEILHGTNSHDRRIGAAAVVRTLVARGAIGLVTTHDLALARIAEDLAERAANVHFEDQVIDGRMHFDYRMRPGVVTRSNALALMRAVGLEV